MTRSYSKERRPDKNQQAGPLWRILLAVVIFITLVTVTSGTAMACEIPVYEYALLNWAPDDYELLVFHAGPLEAEIELEIEALNAADLEENPAINLRVKTLAQDTGLTGGLAQLAEREDPGRSPWMALRYPGMTPDFPSLWVGPATADNLRRVFDSPARRAIADALARGVSHVWVFLESGTEEKDRQARAKFDDCLARLADTIDPEAISPNAHITHEIISVKRNDPAEVVLVHTLLRSEPDLMAYEEPMVFPVFGRGRALYALVGAGIDDENLRDACTYVAGICSCLVKDDNPGVDLLLTADWRGAASHLAQPAAASPGSAQDIAADALPPAGQAIWYAVAALAGALVAVVGLSTLLLRKTSS